MAVWDLASGKKRLLGKGPGRALFLPDGKAVLVGFLDIVERKSSVKLISLATGKILAERPCPDKERVFSLGALSPDGSLLAVRLGGKRAAPAETRFLDARTLEERGTLVGKGNPDGFGWSEGAFTPDGKRYVALDGAGNALVWDIAGKKVVRTIRYAPNAGWAQAISPDGKTLAVSWRPATEDEDGLGPQELAQPRVALLDLRGKKPARTLFAPPGQPGTLAFSPDGKLLAFGGTGAVHLFDLSE